MKKAFVITISALAVIIIGIYVAGIIVSHKYFMPHTFVNGQDVGYKTAEEAEEILQPTVGDIIVHGLESDEVIKLEDFGYNVSLTKSVSEMIDAQNQFYWIRTLFYRTDLEDPVDFEYNEEALKAAVSNMEMLNPANIREPRDAYLDRDEGGHYFIVPEDNGNSPYPDKVYEAIKTAIDGGHTEVFLDTETVYKKAAITKDDPEMMEFIEKARSLNEEEIIVDMVDAEEVLDTVKLLDMAYKDEDGNIHVDDDLLMEFVRGLTDKYDTFKQAQPFITHDGRNIYVGGNETDGPGFAQDTYGFYLDEQGTWYDLKQAIESGVSQTVEAVWEIPALARTNYNGCIGDRYIEISLEDQHLWAFWDGRMIMETDLVTGLGADEAKWSPAGLFRIWDRSSPATLTGEMAGESWESHVDFWMGITWTGVGLHNAPWRGAFGGDIYMYNGSHGCINMSYEAAETLYHTYDFDYPVVIY